MKTLLAVAIVLFWTALASAQGYVITTPGQMPTYVRPNGVGGYTATTPGRMPSYINQNGVGGYTVTTPGQMPSYVQPSNPNPFYRQNRGW